MLLFRKSTQSWFKVKDKYNLTLRWVMMIPDDMSPLVMIRNHRLLPISLKLPIQMNRTSVQVDGLFNLDLLVDKVWCGQYKAGDRIIFQSRPFAPKNARLAGVPISEYDKRKRDGLVVSLYHTLVANTVAYTLGMMNNIFIGPLSLNSFNSPPFYYCQR